MARTGLYQSEVKKARDALLGQGRHPSVDAVRVELGNTGSKTTIHKYLKELEQEEGAGRKASVSEALRELVDRLAARLHEEADGRVAEIEAQSASQQRLHAEAQGKLQLALEAHGEQLKRADAELQRETAAHARTQAALQKESIRRHTAEQQVVDLQERLRENEGHRQSLEEKHQHARHALEHYRQSVKEQREQDQRRHEQQVQQLQAEARQLQQGLIVRQDEATRLNQEGARLVAELAHTRQALYDQQSLGRRQEQKIEQLQAMEHEARGLEAQLAGKMVQERELIEKLGLADEKNGQLADRVRGLELALATAQATLAAQQGMVADLRTCLMQRLDGDAEPGRSGSA